MSKIRPDDCQEGASTSGMDTGAILSPWLPFETRQRDRDAKREAVLRTAVRLFLEQGYHRATLTEVAERLNITKPALYNYFRGKDEILFECWTLGQDAVFGCAATIDASGGAGLAKLREFVRSYARLMTTDYGQSLARFDIRDMSHRHAAVARSAKRRIDTVFRGYVAEGVADGSIIRCDPKLTAFAIAGSLNWIGHWYRPGGALGADEIAESFVEQLTGGLAARRDVNKNKEKKGKPG